MRALCFTAVLLLSGTALAWPSREAGTVVAGGSPAAVRLSRDGRHVALLSRDGTVRLWDRRGFSAGPTTWALEDCSTPSGLTFVEDGLGYDHLWVGCEERLIQRATLDTSSVPAALSPQTDIDLGTATGAVSDLVWAAGDGHVHAVVSVTTNWELHRVRVADGVIDGGNLPLSGSGSPQGLAINDDGALAIADDVGSLHLISRNGDSYSNLNVLLHLLGTLSDVSAGTGFTDFMATEVDSGELWRVTPQGTVSLVADDLGEPLAVEWLDSQHVLICDSAGGAAVIDVDGDEIVSFGLSDGNGTDLVAVDGGDLAFAALAGGSLGVLSDAPWIDGLSADPATLREGEEARVAFTLDLAADWEVRAGGDGESGSGAGIASGEAAAGDGVELTVAAADLPEEGENLLWVRAIGEPGSSTDVLVLTRDMPPEAVTGLAAGAADQALIVSWNRGDEPDLDHWVLYLGDAAFDEGTLPSFTVEGGDARESYPRTVPAAGADDVVEERVSGLTNGVTYYVAVRAVDEGGQEGALSALASANPASTCSAAECAGDTGGCACTTADPGVRFGVFVPLLPLLPLLLSRARRARAR